MPRKTAHNDIKFDEIAAQVGSDMLPEAWDKFESLVKGAAKMGPKPHDPAPSATAKKPKPSA